MLNRWNPPLEEGILGLFCVLGFFSFQIMMIYGAQKYFVYTQTATVVNINLLWALTGEYELSMVSLCSVFPYKHTVCGREGEVTIQMKPWLIYGHHDKLVWGKL